MPTFDLSCLPCCAGDCCHSIFGATALFTINSSDCATLPPGSVVLTFTGTEIVGPVTYYLYSGSYACSVGSMAVVAKIYCHAADVMTGFWTHNGQPTSCDFSETVCDPGGVTMTFGPCSLSGGTCSCALGAVVSGTIVL